MFRAGRPKDVWRIGMRAIVEGVCVLVVLVTADAGLRAEVKAMRVPSGDQAG